MGRVFFEERKFESLNDIKEYIMKISACYIAKNEEKNIGRSIASLQTAVDEIIVVDTGSEDKTKEIAASFGAKIFDFVWCDDFAKARNFALEQATGDGIVFLDADEAFENSEGLRKNLEIMLAQKNIDVWLLPRKNIEKRTDGGISVIDYDYSARVLKNSKKLRYSGRIHESPQRAERDIAWGYAEKSMMLLHDGYAGDICEEKARRDLKILLEEVKARGNILRYAFYLSDCYYILKDYAKALSYAEMHVNADTGLVGGESHMYHVGLECMRKLDTPLEKQIHWTEGARDKFPELPDFHAEKGVLLSAAGRMEEAKAELLDALIIFEEKKYPLYYSSSFSETVAAMVSLRLAEISVVLGEYSDAELYFSMALKYDGDNNDVKSKLWRIRDRMKGLER